MRMNRREVVVPLLALGVSPLASAQQAGRTYRLGWFAAVPRAEQTKTEPYSVAFEQRLRELGFVEGRNLVIEFRSDEGLLRILKPRQTSLACRRNRARRREAVGVEERVVVELLESLPHLLRLPSKQARKRLGSPS
jgi:Fe2+ transport system protein FeoA